MSESISIIHQNVQSLGNKIDRLQYTLQSHPSCSFLCITEHWKSENQLKLLKLQKFKLVSAICRKEGSHGGAAVYAHENLKAVPRKPLNGLSVIGSFECAVAECSAYNESIIITSIYRPPAGDMQVFLNSLETLLTNLSTENKTLLIAGDFNIEMVNENKNKSDLLSLLESFDLNPTITDYTRITSNCQSCLDNIFTNLDINWKSEILDTHISDHTAQKLTFQVKNNNVQKNCKYSRSFNTNAIQHFKQKLENQEWKAVFEVEEINVDEKWETFMDEFLLLFNESFPLKHLANSKKNFKYNNKELNAIKNKLDILLVLCRYNEHYTTLYNATKREYDNMLGICRSQDFQNRIQKSENKSKTMWNICNEILGKKKETNCNLNGKPVDIAENLNKYFAHTVKDTQVTVNQYTEPNNIQYNIQSMYLTPTSPDEINEISKSLKSKYSAGDDNIPIIIIKECINQVKAVLSHLINCSFKHGIFPRQLKLAVITPLFKGGDPQNMNNYRPISLLPSFSKFFEIAISNRVIHFINNCNLISESQHGYLRGRSTLTAIYQFTQSILKLLEDNKLALGIFLDLSKAYDCIDADYLIKKMNNYGIRGNALRWFQSYLSDRQQRVKILKNGNVIKSSIIANEIGIAQGSVAGPLAFIIFLNDLSSVVTDETNRIINYADDTNLITGHTDIPQLINNGNVLFRQAKKWFEHNKLVINEQKTNVVLFSTSRTRKEKPTKIKLDGVDIDLVSHTKFLGVTLDQFLNWAPHITELSSHLNSICYAVRISGRYLDTNTLKIIYHANFESLMRYAIIFWGISSSVKNVFVIQKRTIRIIFGMEFRESCRGIFRTNKILTIYALYLYECLIFLFKNRQLFTGYNTNTTYNTRTQDLNYPIHRLSLTEKSPSYMCLKIYNRLPNHIKNIDNLQRFKTTIKNMLIELEPYELDDYFL